MAGRADHKSRKTDPGPVYRVSKRDVSEPKLPNLEANSSLKSPMPQRSKAACKSPFLQAKRPLF